MCVKNAETARFQVRAPAKINLCLAVTGRRPDGYHKIFSLMAAVGLFDDIRLELAGSGITVECGAEGVPQDETNLAAIAARHFFDAAGRCSGLAIRIDKRIPVGAGLGGGSSDAAAVLTGLNRHFGCPLDSQSLHCLAARIGADVPFFIEGRPALATGIGDRLRAYRGLSPMHVLIVFPGVSVPTAAVYGAVRLRLTACGKKSKIFALKTQPFDATQHLYNDLEAVAGEMYPVILEAKSVLLAEGADGAMMTGSGSAVFGLFKEANAVVRARSAIGRHCRDWQFYCADLIL